MAVNTQFGFPQAGGPQSDGRALLQAIAQQAQGQQRGAALHAQAAIQAAHAPVESFQRAFVQSNQLGLQKEQLRQESALNEARIGEIVREAQVRDAAELAWSTFRSDVAANPIEGSTSLYAWGTGNENGTDLDGHRLALAMVAQRMRNPFKPDEFLNEHTAVDVAKALMKPRKFKHFDGDKIAQIALQTESLSSEAAEMFTGRLGRMREDLDGIYFSMEDALSATLEGPERRLYQMVNQIQRNQGGQGGGGATDISSQLESIFGGQGRPDGRPFTDGTRTQSGFQEIIDTNPLFGELFASTSGVPPTAVYGVDPETGQPTVDIRGVVSKLDPETGMGSEELFEQVARQHPTAINTARGHVPGRGKEQSRKVGEQLWQADLAKIIQQRDPQPTVETPDGATPAVANRAADLDEGSTKDPVAAFVEQHTGGGAEPKPTGDAKATALERSGRKKPGRGIYTPETDFDRAKRIREESVPPRSAAKDLLSAWGALVGTPAPADPRGDLGRARRGDRPRLTMDAILSADRAAGGFIEKYINDPLNKIADNANAPSKAEADLGRIRGGTLSKVEADRVRTAIEMLRGEGQDDEADELQRWLNQRTRTDLTGRK